MTLKNNFFFATVACAAVLVEGAWGGQLTFTRLNPVGGSVGEFNSGSINNNGVVVGQVGGQVFTYNVATQAYTYYSLPGFSSLAGIDNAGNIAYTSTSEDAHFNTFFHGAVYSTSNATVTTFDDSNATQYTFATSISNNGKIAGYYDDQFFTQLGFSKSGNSFTDVTFPGNPFAQKYVFGINNSGDVIGLSSCCPAGANYLLKNGVYTAILDRSVPATMA